MFKIGDFSQLGQVSVRMLRHYDDMGLLRPAHIDQFTGYRYYKVEQLPRLNRILALKDLGLSLEQIARLIENDLPAAQLRDLLAQRQGEIAQQIREEQARLLRVEARLRQIELEGQVSPYEVVLKDTEPLIVATTRRVVPTAAEMGYHCHNLYEMMYAWADQQPIKPQMEITFYYNTEYTEQDIDMEASLVLDSLISSDEPHIQIRTLPALPLVASVIHEGCFEHIGNAITALMAWVFDNGYHINGVARELHHSGSVFEENKNHIIEVQFPVEKG